MRTRDTESPDGQRVIEAALQQTYQQGSDDGRVFVDANAIADKLGLPLDFVRRVLDAALLDQESPS